MNRDFLKEAIADAKAVKESAIANAKVALEEAFSPQVKAMFASKLEEMEKEEMEEGYKDAEKMEEEMSDPVMRKDLEGDDAAEKETELMREEEDMELEEILAELDELDLNEAEDKMDEAEGGGKKQFKICARQDPCSGDNESKDKPYCSFL